MSAPDGTVPSAATTPATILIEWDRRKWTVPADPDDWDFSAIEALEAGKSVAFLRAVLGRKEFARFENGQNRTAKAASELMKAVMAAVGEEREGE